jgi:hypothetical protein
VGNEGSVPPLWPPISNLRQIWVRVKWDKVDALQGKRMVTGHLQERNQHSNNAMHIMITTVFVYHLWN